MIQMRVLKWLHLLRPPRPQPHYDHLKHQTHNKNQYKDPLKGHRDQLLKSLKICLNKRNRKALHHLNLYRCCECLIQHHKKILTISTRASNLLSITLE